VAMQVDPTVHARSIHPRCPREKSAPLSNAARGRAP
jgi:hypothetical protein